MPAPRLLSSFRARHANGSPAVALSCTLLHSIPHAHQKGRPSDAHTLLSGNPRRAGAHTGSERHRRPALASAAAAAARTRPYWYPLLHQPPLPAPSPSQPGSPSSPAPAAAAPALGPTVPQAARRPPLPRPLQPRGLALPQLARPPILLPLPQAPFPAPNPAGMQPALRPSCCCTCVEPGSWSCPSASPMAQLPPHQRTQLFKHCLNWEVAHAPKRSQGRVIPSSKHITAVILEYTACASRGRCGHSHSTGAVSLPYPVGAGCPSTGQQSQEKFNVLNNVRSILGRGCALHDRLPVRPLAAWHAQPIGEGAYLEVLLSG